MAAIVTIVCVVAAHPVQAASVRVKSWCPATGSSGIGFGATVDQATQRAVESCVAHGGYRNCCTTFHRQV